MPGLTWSGGQLISLDAEGNALARHWDERMLPVKFVLSKVGYLNSDLSNAEIAEQIEIAMQKWESLSTSDIRFQYAGEVDKFQRTGESVVAAGVDGYNLITFADPDVIFDDETLAYCYSTTITHELVITDANNDLNGDGVPDLVNGVYPPGTIIDADIVFDGQKVFKIAQDQPGHDLQSVLLHEIGHCFGLSHSSIPDAVMFPFTHPDFETGRTLHDDDQAYASLIYPTPTQFDTHYGIITGNIRNGADSKPVVGAHVYALDPATGLKVVGGYSDTTGNYRLPVRAGTYYVGIEPLDGDPRGLDPERISPVIANTLDTGFPEEFYDAAESASESDETPLAVNVAAGGIVEQINLITNEIARPSHYLLLQAGINYISYPVSVPEGIDAFGLLNAFSQNNGIQSIQRINPETGEYEKAQFINGQVYGKNFPIKRGEGYIAHSLALSTVGVLGSPDCPTIDLRAGLNLVGAVCAPGTMTAHQWLEALGGPVMVESIARYNHITKSFDRVAFDTQGTVVGADFKVEEGIGYLVKMHHDFRGFTFYAKGKQFPPVLQSLSPGQGTPGSLVYLLGQGFSTDPDATVVSFNGVGARILSVEVGQIVAQVPYNASSGPVIVTVNDKSSNAIHFDVLNSDLQEVEGEVMNMVSGQRAYGQIDSDGDEDVYRFMAIKGNRLFAELRVVSGSPKLTMTLYSPFGGQAHQVMTNGNLALINNLTLPETGYYELKISAAPGTGTGSYRLDLTIKSEKQAPEVHVLQGDGQTVAAGSELGIPVSIVTSGPNGLPAAGVPVTFVVQPVDDSVASRALSTSNAASMIGAGAPQFSVNSNNSGTVLVRVFAPAKVGDFHILISGPGMQPATLTVAVIPRAIKRIEIEGNHQTGTVGKALENPYTVTFFDDEDNPVSGVRTSWQVVSGNGSIREAGGAGGGFQLTPKSDAQGQIKIEHILGKKAYLNTDASNPQLELIRQPQQVALVLPGQVAPVLFSAIAKPDDPTKFEIKAAAYTRISMGTVRTSAIKVVAQDQYDNPAPGATVSISIPNGVQLLPGSYHGKVYATNKTDEQGFWAGALGAFPGATPTYDEFGNTKSSPVPVTVSVGGTSKTFYASIDMGPALVTEQGSNASNFIGKPLGIPVSYLIYRYQRVDRYIPVEGEQDDDLGDWTDEDYSLVRQVPVKNHPVALSLRRGDDKDLAGYGLRDTLINGASQVTLQTDNDGRLLLNNVVLGDVAGLQYIISTAQDFNIPYFHDRGRPGQTGEKFTERHFPADTIATPLNIKPVTVDLLVEDMFPDGGKTVSPEPYPGIGRVSGINLEKLKVNYLERDLLMPTALRTFPNYLQIYADGIALESLRDGTGGGLQDTRPAQLRVVYLPTGKELREGQVLQIEGLQDAAGNEAAAQTLTIQIP